jgi:ATP-dependent RNA helicase MSS116
VCGFIHFFGKFTHSRSFIQFGVPASREQYIHRLGRTARAGTEGEGILVLHPFDGYFLREVADLPLKKINKAEMDKQLAPYLPEDRYLKEAMRKVPSETRAQCYSAWLGFYNGLCPKRIRWSKAELVEWANYFATDTLLCNQIPALLKKTVGKMGIKGTPGLVVH